MVSGLVEILKQGQYQPLPVAKQVVAIYAANNGYVDEYPASTVGRYESELLAFIDSKHAALINDLTEKKAIDADLEGRLKAALEEFKGQFVA